MEKQKKVLVVTYYWLPHSGTGTYRVSKLVKYLIRAGWEPVILTPSKSASSHQEKNLEQIYRDVKVYQTKILEPTFLFTRKKNAGSSFTNASFFLSKNQTLKQKIIRWIRINLFIPDAKILWKPFAVRTGKEVIEKEKPDLIFSTAPPPSTHLIAKKLSQWSNLKWIADFRDPWTNIFYLEFLRINPISKKINQFLEKQVLRAASKVTTVSDGFFSDSISHHKNIRIENGFDPDDLDNLPVSQVKNNKFTIRYIGSLKTNQFFKNFLLILKELGENKEFKDTIRLELTGFIDPSIREFIESEEIKLEIITEGYIPHDQAVRKMAEADLLILAIGKGQLSKNVISTKIFEYLLAQRPILAFGHTDGTANRILKETRAGKMFTYDEYEPVKGYLLELYHNWKTGVSSYQGDTE